MRVPTPRSTWMHSSQEWPWSRRQTSLSAQLSWSRWRKRHSNGSTPFHQGLSIDFSTSRHCSWLVSQPKNLSQNQFLVCSGHLKVKVSHSKTFLSDTIPRCCRRRVANLGSSPYSAYSRARYQNAQLEPLKKSKWGLKRTSSLRKPKEPLLTQEGTRLRRSATKSVQGKSAHEGQKIPCVYSPQHLPHWHIQRS